MNLTINGKDEILDQGLTLENLLKRRKMNPDIVVVEHNRKIVPKEQLPNIKLSDSDNIEIISFVGGG